MTFRKQRSVESGEANRDITPGADCLVPVRFNFTNLDASMRLKNFSWFLKFGDEKHHISLPPEKVVTLLVWKVKRVAAISHVLKCGV